MTVCLMMIFGGCSEEQKSADVNQIPTEIADEKSDKSANDTKTDEPARVAQEGKDYIVAADDLSNLQLNDPTIPVYDKYIIWERQEKGLPIILPELEPYEAESVVYLTFDDGPDDKITPQILDILKAEGVKATFYVCGNMVDAYPDVLKRIFNEGHAIGNHSYNHPEHNKHNSWGYVHFATDRFRGAEACAA